MGKSYWHYPPGFTASIFIVNVMLYSTTGITLSPCSDNTVELEETRVDNNITCSGISDLSWEVNWQLTLPGRPTIIAGNCNAGSTSCTSATAVGYMATRPSPDTSVLFIDLRVNLGFVRNGTLKCQSTKLGQTETQSCHMDIITLPSDVKCTVQLDTNTPSVIGRCDITKVYSYNGRYSFRWHSKQESGVETEVTPVSIQTTPTADITPTGGNYFNVSCDVNTTSLSGNTSYGVVIFPGGFSYYAGNIIYSSKESGKVTDNCWLYLLLLLLLLLLPIPVPPPWPGYPIYVLICWCVCNRNRGTGCWHPHYICGKRTNDVYFSACFVTSDGRAVLIWSKSSEGRFLCYGTETTPGTNSSGARHEMDAPPSHSNNVSSESAAVNNGNKHTSQKEKNKHTGTDGSKDSS